MPYAARCFAAVGITWPLLAFDGFFEKADRSHRPVFVLLPTLQCNPGCLRRNIMGSRSKIFLSYYKPYLGLLVADLVCAFIVSAITLVLPLCARYITKNILERNTSNTLSQIYIMGAIM